jgi:hypothetical protein
MKIFCPRCSQKIAVETEAIGQALECPTCKTGFVASASTLWDRHREKIFNVRERILKHRDKAWLIPLMLVFVYWFFPRKFIPLWLQWIFDLIPGRFMLNWLSPAIVLLSLVHFLKLRWNDLPGAFSILSFIVSGLAAGSLVIEWVSQIGSLENFSPQTGTWIVIAVSIALGILFGIWSRLIVIAKKLK